MNTPAVSVLTYVWHYIVARGLYDHVVHPVSRGDGSQLAVLAGIACLAFIAGRVTARRR